MSEQEEYKGICNVCGKEEMVMLLIHGMMLKWRCVKPVTHLDIIVNNWHEGSERWEV